MILEFEHLGKHYKSDLDAGVSLAIGLDFNGPQPNHFGTASASRQPLQAGPFVGDTRRGGGCNVDVLKMVPHCNGTHTESIGHIVDEDVFVGTLAREAWYPTVVLTLRPIVACESGDQYRPDFQPDDWVISSAALQQAFDEFASLQPAAMVIRTLPNDRTKMSRVYKEGNAPPFFSVEAMELVNRSNVQHLLVDLPSVDRMHDDGLLTCHHLYWNVPEQTHQIVEDSWQDKTISEMIYVPDQIEDGFYLLNLQVPELLTDAAPSRPILFPCQLV